MKFLWLKASDSKAHFLPIPLCAGTGCRGERMARDTLNTAVGVVVGQDGGGGDFGGLERRDSTLGTFGTRRTQGLGGSALVTLTVFYTAGSLRPRAEGETKGYKACNFMSGHQGWKCL